MKTHSLNLAATLLLSLTAHGAERNLPELSSLTEVERVKVFPSVKGTHWFLPLALQSSLDCSPESTSKRSCFLRIHNSLSSSEEAGLQKLQRGSGQVVFFRDVDAGIVKGIEETVQGLSTTVPSLPPMFLKTLALSPDTPYVQVQFRGSGSKVAQLIEEYKTTGLGEFVSEVRFNGEHTLSLIKVTQTDELQTFLGRAVKTSISLSELKALVKKLSKSGALLTLGYSPEEAITLTTNAIQRTFLGKPIRGKYKADAGRVSTLEAEFVVDDETETPVSAVCKVTLQLRENGDQTTRCREEE